MLIIFSSVSLIIVSVSLIVVSFIKDSFIVISSSSTTSPVMLNNPDSVSTSLELSKIRYLSPSSSIYTLASPFPIMLPSIFTLFRSPGFDNAHT